MPNAGLQGSALPSPPDRTSLTWVRDQLALISALTTAGSVIEARSACADTMFGFQPLIASDPDLTARFAEVLGACGATVLRRRFLIAIHGEETGGPPVAVFPVSLRRAPWAAPRRAVTKENADATAVRSGWRAARNIGNQL